MASSSSAALTQRWISPQSAASTPADLLAEQQHLLARARPTSRGSSQVEPESGAEAAADERLPEHRVVGGDGEVRGQRQVAAEPDGPAPHAAHDGQLDGVDQFDQRGGRCVGCAAPGRRCAAVARRCWWPPSRRPRRSRLPRRGCGWREANRRWRRRSGRSTNVVDHRMAQRVAPRRAIERETQESPSRDAVTEPSAASTSDHR